MLFWMAHWYLRYLDLKNWFALPVLEHSARKLYAVLILGLILIKKIMFINKLVLWNENMLIS